VRVALVYNPVAGESGGVSIDDVRERLGVGDLVFETSRDREADQCARAAVAAGAELVIAAGGDGTVSAVAGALVGTDVALGIVPRGTSNSIAAALGIPDDLDGAVAVLEAGDVRTIDTARCGDRPMVLYATVGLQAEAVRRTPREAKNAWGVLAYVASGLRELVGMTPFDVELETDAHVIRCSAIAVAVANLAATKTIVAQGPSAVVPDDALLDVTIVSSTGLMEAVAAGLHLLRTAVQGDAATRDNVGYFSCQRVRISPSPPQHVLVDGEDAGQTPMTITCLPRSLRVVAPPAAESRDAPEAKLVGLHALEVERKAP
jgi:YegS/Rv2252/BmrU family lipid kinase